MMTMYYGVEQSTDLRNQKTRVKKFRTRRAVLRWMETSGGYTYRNPDLARNHHHTFRDGYELYGRIRQGDPIFSDTGTSTYPRCREDNLASYIRKYGERIRKDGEAWTTTT